MQELWAIIFKPWPDKPIYHSFIGHSMTKCGRRVGPYTPMLPAKHVKKFGRPCRSCYPA